VRSVSFAALDAARELLEGMLPAAVVCIEVQVAAARVRAVRAQGRGRGRCHEGRLWLLMSIKGLKRKEKLRWLLFVSTTYGCFLRSFQVKGAGEVSGSGAGSARGGFGGVACLGSSCCLSCRRK